MAKAACNAPVTPGQLGQELGAAELSQVGRKRWHLRGLKHQVEVTGSIAADAPAWQLAVELDASARPALSDLARAGLTPELGNDEQSTLVRFQNPCPEMVIRVWGRLEEGGHVERLVWVFERPAPPAGSTIEDPIVPTLDMALWHLAHRAPLRQLEQALELKLVAREPNSWSHDFPNEGGRLTVRAAAPDAPAEAVRFEATKETWLSVQDLSTRWGTWTGWPGHESAIIFFHPKIDGSEKTVVAQLEGSVPAPNLPVGSVGFSHREGNQTRSRPQGL
ncbi:MAG: hypothetical protein KA712_06010 [Myxococcales bacterium]|nr:hypothetical protein [Myxococcales bacterium]